MAKKNQYLVIGEHRDEEGVATAGDRMLVSAATEQIAINKFIEIVPGSETWHFEVTNL